MDITQISAGPNPPADLHAVVEIPVGGLPVKYELDKRSGAMFVDRFLHTAMLYPGNRIAGGEPPLATVVDCASRLGRRAGSRR